MAFSIRKYLGIDGSGESAVNHDNKANPLPEELLNRVDKDIAELIALICNGKKAASTSDPSKPPATAEDFKNNLNDAIKNGGLGEFYEPNDPTVTKLAETAADLLKDPKYPLKDGNQIAVVARTCLYKIALYCDDSLSMTQESRIATQVTFVRRFANLILPMQDGAINLRFINASAPGTAWDNMNNVETIAAAVQSVPYTGYTPIGGNLKSKVIEPMLYSQFPGGVYNKKLKPVAALVITDGWPYNEADDHMRNVIAECIQRVKAAGYKKPENVIKFQINQIGHETRSTAFIQGLYNDQEIKPNVYCTSEILDDKIQELKDNEAGLNDWIVNKLSVEL
ncbi:hypothetical protein DFH27DRAFT_552517 [Peziza echinospora]|nr:hypothetical protein DFH27DRAFT_552517 [Peziza echinospora]